jgi:hypothetical protein
VIFPGEDSVRSSTTAAGGFLTDPRAAVAVSLGSTDPRIRCSAGEIEKYSNSAKLFPKWAKKVGELRADLLQRWQRTKESLAGGTLADETAKIWADYGSADWYWSEMTEQSAAGRYDTARGYYETYKKYDDSALRRANELGYSGCDYAWPRPNSW